VTEKWAWTILFTTRLSSL